MASEYCDIEITKMLLETDFPLFKIKVQNQYRPIYYTLPQEHPDWSNCDAYYIPSIYEVQKWLREKKGIIIVIPPYSYDYINETHTWTYEVWLGDNLERDAHKFHSYEEALLEGVRASVKLLKEEK